MVSIISFSLSPHPGILPVSICKPVLFRGNTGGPSKRASARIAPHRTALQQMNFAGRLRILHDRLCARCMVFCSPCFFLPFCPAADTPLVRSHHFGCCGLPPRPGLGLGRPGPSRSFPPFHMAPVADWAEDTRALAGVSVYGLCFFPGASCFVCCCGCRIAEC